MSTLSLTMTSRLKHGDLYAAAKQLGGQSALARHLNIGASTVGMWCNLQQCPPTCVDEIGSAWQWTEERIAMLEQQLFKLTGKLLGELFPPELRHNKEFLAADKRADKTQSVDLMAVLADEAAERLCLPDPTHEAMANENKHCIESVLKTLSYREREIIKLRFGVNGGPTYTIEEVAHIFKVTRERIRQLEHKALYRLGHGDRAARLRPLLD